MPFEERLKIASFAGSLVNIPKTMLAMKCDKSGELKTQYQKQQKANRSKDSL